MYFWFSRYIVCFPVLQPVSNQYNITEKIKEANQQLYKAESVQRQSLPKVRFKDHKLVDFEPEDDNELMEKVSNSSKIGKSDDESSDDGYIDDETVDTTVIEENCVSESLEIEDVCEQIEQFETSESHEVEPKDIKEENNHENVADEPEGSELEKQCSDLYETKLSKLEKTSRKKTYGLKSSKVNPYSDILVEDQTVRSKTCCYYKKTDEYKQKLPKYNGFNSNYGLSKEEIAKRELIYLKHKQHRQHKHNQRVEQKEFLARTNEEAFAKW